MRPILCTLAGLLLTTAPAMSSVMMVASPVSIDGFTDPGAILSGNGVSVGAPGTGTTPATDTGLSGVLGGSRATTLTYTAGQGNGDVTLKLTGNGLMYNSGNGANIADGSFNLFYNGAAGFPADFSGNTGITLHLDSQNNPGNATSFVVTLTSGGSTFVSATEFLVGNTNGSDITFLFAGFSNNLVGSGALGAISSVNLFVDPVRGTNMVLDSFQLSGTAGGGGGGSGNLVDSAVPEPATLAVVGGLALAGALGYRRRRTVA